MTGRRTRALRLTAAVALAVVAVSVDVTAAPSGHHPRTGGGVAVRHLTPATAGDAVHRVEARVASAAHDVGVVAIAGVAIVLVGTAALVHRRRRAGGGTSFFVTARAPPGCCA